MSIAEIKAETRRAVDKLNARDLARVRKFLAGLAAAKKGAAATARPSLAGGFGLWQGRRLDSRKFVASLRGEWKRA
jgi:hypothetical protein